MATEKITKLTEKEFDVLLHNLSIADVLHNALINVLGETLLIETDYEKTYLLTFVVPILPDDIEGIFHKYWLEQYPFMADRIEYKIEKKDVNTIVVEYFLKLDDADIRKLINSYLYDKYEYWDEDELGFTFFKCNEEESANISSNIFRFLAQFGIHKEQVGLEIHLQFAFNLSERCVLCGAPIMSFSDRVIAYPLADGVCCKKCRKEKVIPALKAMKK